MSFVRCSVGRRASLRGVWGVVWLAAVFSWGCTEVPLDPVPLFAEDQRALLAFADGEGTLQYVVLGDWGRRGGLYQDEVADQMGLVAQRVASDFVISTGDNFYDRGVSSVRDSHWKESFEEIYTHASLRTPWYVILGNHDYKGNVQAQIDYSGHSRRWTLPSTYYSVVQDIDAATRARFVFIDTQPIREGAPSAPRQLRWLDSTLAASDAAWRVAVGHHPIYSGGYHGDEDALIRDLKPILEKHGVDAYFSGHDHDLQHLHDGRLHYFVSGAGSRLRETDRHRFTRFGITRPGFAVVSMTPSQMVVHFVDHLGNILYGTRLERRAEDAP